MQIPTIQIRQSPGKIAIETTPAQLNLQQPGPTVDMKQIKPEQHFSTTPGNLEINQDKAWDALGFANNLEMMSRIYTKASDIALQGIARIVENGNRMAAIHLGGNPIADMAWEWRHSFPEMDVQGPSSFDNVDLSYTPSKVNIDTTPGRVELNVQVNRPVAEYQRGNVNIYVSQFPNLEIIPPQIDLRL